MQGKNKKNGVTKLYWYKLCKVCYNLKALTKTRKYKQKNREKLSDYQKDYYANNKRACSITKSKCYQNKKQKYVDRAKKNLYNRRKNDILFVLKERISSRVREAIFKNRQPITKFLPYTIRELKEHLEKQFESWMTWENYGTYRVDIWDDSDQSTWTWQIDHIVAHSLFNYTSMEDEEFQKCWSLKNLRPYSAKQNVKDGVRYESC